MSKNSPNRAKEVLAVLGLAAFASGCDSAAASPEEPAADCPAGVVCNVTGVPFVTAAFSTTSDVPDPFSNPRAGETSRVTSPESGRFCASGTIQSGWAQLGLSFLVGDEHSPFASGLDATGLGITQARFQVDGIPTSGLTVQLSSVTPGCLPEEAGCLQHSFFLHEANAPSGIESGIVSITTPTLVTAELADFELAPFISDDWTLNTRALATLNVGIGAFRAATEDYDFCMSDLQFLDATGNEVRPRQ